MTSRIHIRPMRAIVVALAIVTATASAAAAGGNGIRYSEPGSTGYVPQKHVSIPSSMTDFREPGSTGYVPTKVTIPAHLRNFREPGSVGWVPAAGSAATTAAAAGLDWTSAVIGGGVVLGVGLVSAGAVLALRRRSGLAHA